MGCSLIADASSQLVTRRSSLVTFHRRQPIAITPDQRWELARAPEARAIQLRIPQDAQQPPQVEAVRPNGNWSLIPGDKTKRRAEAVRDYLIHHGIDAKRLTTVSFGESQPKYDNSKKETRRLNRRAALVVNIEG